MTVRAGADCPGFSFVEVLVALLILAVALTGVVGGVLHAQGRAAALAQKLTGAGDRAAADDHAVSRVWLWGGPRVVRVEWLSESTLEVRVLGAPLSSGDGLVPAAPVPPALAGENGGGLLVGAWVDGWFAGEVKVGSAGTTEVGAGVSGCERWPEDVAGAEIVLRARGTGGPWGAPWRTVCPSGPEPAGGAAGPVGAGVRVHMPMSVAIEVLLDVDGVPLLSGPLDEPGVPGPLSVLVPAEGLLGVATMTGTQNLILESGRWVDVYF